MDKYGNWSQKYKIAIGSIVGIAIIGLLLRIHDTLLRMETLLSHIKAQ